MKNLLAIAALSCILFSSCDNRPADSGEKQEEKKQKNIVAPGTLITADSMTIADDPLNQLHFAVRVVSTQYTTTHGTYQVQAHYGHNYAESEFSMPRGGEDLKPVLRKANRPNTYDIGFSFGDDAEFYDYYRVTGGRNTIKMEYTKAYSFK